ncbi:MAG: hypothetical protein IIU29_04525, partial [Erysipelotrichaceae bacterium]|nr:hypothetical protein [Erysipelotrichaceae bacterium]
MKDKISILFLCLLFLLSSCKDNGKDMQKKAKAYYEKKYDLKDVTLSDPFKAGNSGLFGYIGVEDLAFEVSDGSFIYYDKEEDRFYDSKQAEQIEEDFETKLLPELLKEIRSPYVLKDSRIAATRYESFDECVFHEYYDGDIRDYLAKERPSISDFLLTVQAQDDSKDQIASLYKKMASYFKGGAEVRVVKEGSSYLLEENKEEYIGRDDEDLIAQASLYFNDRMYWHEPHYVEAMEGVMISSDMADFILEEGDIRLEEVKDGQSFQEILDASYYAMPVDAKENKDGSYTVRDQRHEERIVLDEELPYYRLVLSDRVKEKMKDEL